MRRLVNIAVLLLASVTAVGVCSGALAATEATISVTVSLTTVIVDSDGDGLSDDYETGVLGSDPNDSDSDDDGFGDYEEDQAGTGVTDPNSFPPAVWVQFRYRGVESGTLSNPFNTVAEGVAEGVDAGLPLMFIGTPPYAQSYEHPKLDEPLRMGTRDGAVRIGLIDLDSDGDGLADADEALTYGSSPYNGDTDSDGLDDYAEVVTYGTDPTDVDSDDDSWSDLLEVEWGSDPTNPGDTPVDLWVDFAWTGPTMGTVTQPFNTLAAAQDALTPGGNIGIKGDSTVVETQETVRLTKPMHILAIGGAIRVTSAPPPSSTSGADTPVTATDGHPDARTNQGRPARDLLLEIVAALYGNLERDGDSADDATVPFEPAIPIGANADGLRIAGSSTALAVRLRHPGGIDPASIEVPSVRDGTLSAQAGWRPVHSDNQDVWVLLEPMNGWPEDEEIQVTVRAATSDGVALEPVTYRFVVRDEAAAADSGAGAVRQPQPEIDYMPLALESTGLVRLVPMDVRNDIPALRGAIGPVYAMRPDRLYEEPQRIWVPIPGSYATEELEVFYFLRRGAIGQWLPGDAIDGWLVPGSTLRLDLDQDGESYLGLLAQHPAILQLGRRATR